MLKRELEAERDALSAARLIDRLEHAHTGGELRGLRSLVDGHWGKDGRELAADVERLAEANRDVHALLAREHGQLQAVRRRCARLETRARAAIFEVDVEGLRTLRVVAAWLCVLAVACVLGGYAG